MAGTDHWWDDLTRDRAAALLELVLHAVSDDYQNLEIILKMINRWYRSEPDLKGWKALEAVPVSRVEVVKALHELTQEGFAKASVYDAETKLFRTAIFREDRASVLWFYVTDKGMQAVDRLHKRDPEMS